MEYEGEVVTYVTNKGHQTGNVKTRITFICNETAKWNNTIAKIHGGARAPNPKNIDIINNRVSEYISRCLCICSLVALP